MINGKKFGLALGCGGARGLSHIGVIKTLLNEKLIPDYIAGSSMGAMIGSFLALGKDWDELENLAYTFDKRTSAKALFNMGKVGQSMFGSEKIKKFLKENFGEAKFSDTEIPLAVVASDLVSGEEVIIRDGLIRDAIFASITVPGLFAPVKFGDRILIDGGVLNPTPVDVVKIMGADVVVGVDLITKNRDIKTIPNMLNTLLLSFEIIQRQALEHKLAKAGKNIMIIKPEKRELIDSIKFHDVKEFIKGGEKCMAEALPQLRKLLGLAK